MSTEIIKTGWLKDKEGNKFAPKTLSSQVQTVDGVLLEDKLQEDLNAAKTEILDSVIENIDLSVYETKEDAQNKLAEAKVYVDEQITNHKYSYNDLTDKPFYEETKVVNEPLNITWDGNTEGRVVIDAEGNGEFLFCKVSDLILTDDQIKKCWIRRVGRGTLREAFPIVGEEWDNSVANGAVTEHVVYVRGVVFVRQAEAILNNIVFPEVGIYFESIPNDKDYTHDLYSEEPIEHLKTVVHRLDKKYLPTDICNTFVVEVDWDAGKVITPLNEIRDAWLAHKMVVLFETDVTGSSYVYNLQDGRVYNEYDEGVTGNFASAAFVRINYGHIFFLHIDYEGNVTYTAYDVEMSIAK